MQVKRLLAVIAFLLFMGAGCATEPTPTPPPEEQPSVEEEVVVDEDIIVPLEKDQEAYLACVNAGHTFFISSQSEKELHELFCVFADDTRCRAQDFAAGLCGPHDAATSTPEVTTDGVRSISGLVQGPRFCEPVAAPVCGVDGRTYTNACVARQHNITIAEEGSCKTITETTPSPPQETPPVTPSPTPAPTTPAPTPKPTVKTPSTPVYKTATGWPDWLSIPISLLQATETIPHATMEECIVSNTRYYLQVEGCEDCFATLYGEAGGIICYPNNDIEQGCPRHFSLKNRQCKVLWEK